MGQYLVLIYEDENGYAQGGEAVFGEVMQAHNAFAGKHGAKLAGGQALQPTSSATSIRSDGADGYTVTDGPFLESKEALGGYYLVEAADLDEAIAIAKDCPARFGGVEVRPVMTFD
jgi:hypothetical protein